jgi:L,D-peptidoglycan transpeptidase YkuD (ErfK/YbiS/YcfS/YnhG family)
MRLRRAKPSAAILPRRHAKLNTITVFSTPGSRKRGVLRCGPHVIRCALGRSGVTHLKREGDGATPAGRHRLVWLYARRDRQAGPNTAVATRATQRNDGWCDDPASGRYNCPVHLPFPASHEELWREDRLYDLVGVLDWNIRPRIRGRGSAIFLHVCRSDFAPTAGCVAVRTADLRRLLVVLAQGAELRVSAKPRKIRPSG